MHEVRIGTRGSALALAQARQVRRQLQIKNPSVRFRLIKIKTLGDEYQSVEIFKKNGIGIFTKAIERQLMSRQIDIAVHSLKDLPTDLPKGLVLGAVPKRFPTEDVLISLKRFRLKDLPLAARVGTGSPRRKQQLLLSRPDLRVEDLRGNLDTRISRVLKEKRLDAVVLAKAGLMRLKKYLRYAVVLPDDSILPAVGQGALGIQVRRDDHRTLKIVRRIHDEKTCIRVTAERLFLKALRGGCRVPVGVRSRITGGRLLLKGAVFSVKNESCVRDEVSVPVSRYRTAGTRLAARLLKKGAGRFLTQARATGVS